MADIISIAQPDAEFREHEKAAKFHLLRLNQSLAEAEEHAAELGRELRWLKAHKVGPWYRYVKAEFGLDQRRADELIAIADGKTTVEEMRASTAARMRELRARENPPSRDGGSELSDETIDELADEWMKRDAIPDGDVEYSFPDRPALETEAPRKKTKEQKDKQFWPFRET